MSATSPPGEPKESASPIPYLSLASSKGIQSGDSFVLVVHHLEELLSILGDPPSGCDGVEAVGLLPEESPWSLAALGGEGLPLDIVLRNPEVEYSMLYRLADARLVRPVRVTIPALPGLTKALRLAASMQLPVRLLPGQPDASALGEIDEALSFYLSDPMVEAPVEFFHSTFAVLGGMAEGTIWDFLDENPAHVRRFDEAGETLRGPDFVASHLERLVRENAECVDCRWQEICAGYFKQPNPGYDCAGVKRILNRLDGAAAEIAKDLGKIPPAFLH